MAIFRGPGGSGDATVDSTTQALAATQAAADALTSKNAAATSATNASNSASNASNSATSASNSATTASTQASNAAASASAAGQAALEALEYVGLANDSAAAASDSAISATNSSTLAASYTPSQTDNAGKLLTTNGTATSWKDVTGTGNVVLSTSPTLVTPVLGTPTSVTLTNGTGLPVGGISATGTPSSTTYLRGDGAWSTVSGGGGEADLTDYIETTYPITYTDLGNITASTLAIDITKKWTIGTLTGSGTTLQITGVSPSTDYLEPAHFTILNDGSVTKAVSFDTNLFSISGSVLSQVILPIGYKLDFDVRRNPLEATVVYEVKVGDVNYNQTASGLATTWNPSDYSGTPPLTLSNSNKTIEKTTSNFTWDSARAFGQKITGKWVFAIRCDANMVGASGNQAFMSIGIATPAALLSSFVGQTLNTGSFYTTKGNPSSTVVRSTYDDGVGTVRSTTGSAPSMLGDIIVIAYDADTGKGYVNYNNAWLYSGNPETGTSPIFTLATGNLYLPMISLNESSTAYNAGIWTLLTEIDIAGVMATVPSYKYWTA